MTETDILKRPDIVPNLAPELPRYSLHTWLNPTTPTTRDRLKLCLQAIAKRSGGELFAGPFSVDADGTEGIDKQFLRPDFTPRDRQVMTWWTDKNAKNVKDLPAWTGGVMPHSHGVVYYYDENGENLIDVFVETCMRFDPKPIYEFLNVFWQPEPKHMQSDFKIITTGTPVDPIPGPRNKVNELYKMFTHTQTHTKEEIFRDGRRLEQITLHWDEKKDGIMEDYLTLDENIAMQELYSLYEGELEASTAQRIISGEVSDETAFDYYDRYKRLTDREMEKGGIGKYSKVAFIGGGWLPISAILYARAGAQVTVFEKEKDRAQIAEQVVEKLGLSDKIRVICAQVEKEHLKPFEHHICVIAAMAKPKDEILQSLPEDLTEVIVRTAFRQRHYLYEELKNGSGFRFQPIDYYEAVDPDDVLSFVVAYMLPWDLAADKGEWKTIVREMRKNHGDRVYTPLSPEILRGSLVPESWPTS